MPLILKIPRDSPILGDTFLSAKPRKLLAISNTFHTSSRFVRIYFYDSLRHRERFGGILTHGAFRSRNLPCPPGNRSGHSWGDGSKDFPAGRRRGHPGDSQTPADRPAPALGRSRHGSDSSPQPPPFEPFWSPGLLPIPPRAFVWINSSSIAPSRRVIRAAVSCRDCCAAPVERESHSSICRRTLRRLLIASWVCE